MESILIVLSIVLAIPVSYGIIKIISKLANKNTGKPLIHVEPVRSIKQVESVEFLYEVDNSIFCFVKYISRRGTLVGEVIYLNYTGSSIDTRSYGYFPVFKRNGENVAYTDIREPLIKDMIRSRMLFDPKTKTL